MNVPAVKEEMERLRKELSPPDLEVIEEGPEAPRPPYASLRGYWLTKQPGKHVRAGFTKNKGRKRDSTRSKMSRTSRRINRGIR